MEHIQTRRGKTYEMAGFDQAAEKPVWDLLCFCGVSSWGEGLVFEV